jgi:N-acetylmuramoyl-L-alanine amidase
MRPIRRVIVHHSAGRDTETADDVRRFHTAPPPKGRGWGDIGYHWLIHRTPLGFGGRAFLPTERQPPGPWTVAPGRDETRAGAHDEGQNADSIGVCIAGDYSRGPVPADGWAVLVATVADVCRRYDLTADNIEGHREHEPPGGGTLCPGFDPALLRAAVAEQLRRVA